MSLDNRKSKCGVGRNGNTNINKRQPLSLATRSKGLGAVRIVGGKFKRTPLPVDDIEGLRPTPQRVRETVFDWLTHLTGGMTGLAVCDMFGGSGAMGLEAASRGSDNVVVLEKDRKAATKIRTVVQKLSAQESVQVVCADSLDWMRKTTNMFDVIFIDPPFQARLHAAAIEVAVDHLKPKGLFYLENDELLDDKWLSECGLTVVRRGQAASVHYLLAERKTT